MKSPAEEIERNNSWYIGDQLEAAQIYRLTIQRRCQFIAAAVEQEKLRKLEGGPIRVLDTGCGDGVFIDLLHSHSRVDLWALDYNLLRLKRAKSRFPEVRFSLQDLKQPSLREGKFDIIVMSQVIEHIPEDEKVLKILFDLLLDGGCLILGTPNEGCFLARLRNHFLEPYIRRTTDHIHFYTEKEVRKKIERTGLIIQGVMREGFFFPLSRVNYLFGSHPFLFKLMDNLGKLFPSQVAGFYFLCRKISQPRDSVP
ncbi:MAG: class I SAM-dependent methyltransferase [Deltaproteobacteria bacterium]|nr:class I SAM-dependent methyltransferase [Deltaproteobacteria bacterium]MBM4323509.1 class I SAM-dependent methyltransferase [Deltaproteobacteria bacterium]